MTTALRFKLPHQSSAQRSEPVENHSNLSNGNYAAALAGFFTSRLPVSLGARLRFLDATDALGLDFRGALKVWPSASFSNLAHTCITCRRQTPAKFVGNIFPKILTNCRSEVTPAIDFQTTPCAATRSCKSKSRDPVLTASRVGLNMGEEHARISEGNEGL